MFGTTRRGLLQTVHSDEWPYIEAYQREFDLPDSFLTTGQLGALVAQLGGEGKAQPGHFAPYYKLSRRDSLAAAVDFVRRHGQRADPEPGGAPA